tara:strand:+ start:12 stop:338 length:327 start_codon:yes stop_codon:yes gene_type:complete
MNKVNTWIAVAVGMATLLGGVLGTAFTIDSRYAKTGEIADIKDYVQKIDKRLEIKILKDRADALQERMWKIEDRYGMELAEMSEEVRLQYRELKKEYDDIMDKLKRDD